MKNVLDFLSAALPWVCIGLLLAIFFARSGRKKQAKESKTQDKETKENFGSEGLALGMSFGVSIGTALGNTGIGLTLGMLVGLLIGSCIEKKE